MSELRVHQFEKDLAKATGIEERLFGTRVRTGEVLHITHISGAFTNCATTEYIVLGYYNGHAYVEVYKGKPAVTSDFVHWNGDIWLIEGQYIFAYFADVASDEVMRLRSEGKWE